MNTWVMKVDSNGSKQWDKTIFILEGSGRVVQTTYDCLAVANGNASAIGGYKTQSAWNSGIDYWVAKFCMVTLTSIDDRQIDKYRFT